MGVGETIIHSSEEDLPETIDVDYEEIKPQDG